MPGRQKGIAIMLARIAISALAAIYLLAPATAPADIVMPKNEQAMQDIVESKDLSKAEKLSKLQPYLAERPRSAWAVRWMAQVDPKKAETAALKFFRAKDTSRENKLELGRYLRAKVKTAGFRDEYGKFLVDAVLNGGEKEFMAKRVQDTISAVSEYVSIAGTLSSKDFPKIKDKRVIPILIRCLDAPDNVYGEQRGCDPSHKPDESTKRNTQRQEIPVALAKLGATEAVQSLNKIVRSDRDYWDRFNSAYALGVLAEKKVAREAEKFLRANAAKNNNRLLLFGLGKGLIAKGDDHGVTFMSLKYAHDYGPDDLYVIWQLQERLTLTRGLKSPRMEAFYRETMAHPLFRKLLLFDPAVVTMPGQRVMQVTPDRKSTVEVTTPEGILQYIRPKLVAAYKDILAGITMNGFKGLAGEISAIAAKTQDKGIREMSQAAVKALGEL